jgi:hypothetical protein
LTPLEAGYVEIPTNLAVDIDTPADWTLAEMLYIHEHFPSLSRDMLSRVSGLLSPSKEVSADEEIGKPSSTSTVPHGGAEGVPS